MSRPGKPLFTDLSVTVASVGGDAGAREHAALIVIEQQIRKEHAPVAAMATDALAGELR